jgi:hypothetical protein
MIDDRLSGPDGNGLKWSSDEPAEIKIGCIYCAYSEDQILSGVPIPRWTKGFKTESSVGELDRVRTGCIASYVRGSVGWDRGLPHSGEK